MATTRAPSGGMIAGNLYQVGGRFVAKPLSRVATVMQRLRSRPAAPVKLARAPSAGNPHLQQLAALYRQRHGIDGHDLSHLTEWSRPHAEHMAKVYEGLVSDPHHPDVKAAYRQMAQEVRQQHDFLKEHGYAPEYMTDDPYPHSAAMMKDLADRKRIKVFKTGPGQSHPLLTDEENDMFRYVHDVFGYGMHGHQFGPRGEDNAYRDHASMFSPLARRVMATETRGQNSYVNAGPHSHLPVTERPFAEQKAALWPEHLMGEYHEMPVKVKLARPLRPADPSLLPFEAEDLHGMTTAQRRAIDRHVNRALADKPGLLPTHKEVHALALAGDPVAGGYSDAHKLNSDLFPHGRDDAERWAALNGVLSANTPWLAHTEGATNALALWHQAGRPTDRATLEKLFGDGKRPNVFFNGTKVVPHPLPKGAEETYRTRTASPMYFKDKAWKIVSLLSVPGPFRFDPKLIAGGSYKTPNFAYAHMSPDGVPIDTHMGKLFRRTPGDDIPRDKSLAKAQKLIYGRSGSQHAFKTLLAETARGMGWEPRQVQEAVWTGILALMAAKKDGGKGASFEEAIKPLSRRAVRAGWDMHTVFQSPVMRQALVHLGVTDKAFAKAVEASRERHPIPPVEPITIRDHDTLRGAFEHLPAQIKGANVPIAEEMRRSPVRLSRVRGGVPSSFDALLHMAILASFGS